MSITKPIQLFQRPTQDIHFVVFLSVHVVVGLGGVVVGLGVVGLGAGVGGVGVSGVPLVPEVEIGGVVPGEVVVHQGSSHLQILVECVVVTSSPPPHEYVNHNFLSSALSHLEY